MTTKHTPGPWEQYSDWYIRAEGGSGAVALVSIPYRPHVDHDECRANARLIAASPELLAALQACRIHIETLERMHDHDLPEGQMLRDAIAKANQ